MPVPLPHISHTICEARNLACQDTIGGKFCGHMYYAVADLLEETYFGKDSRKLHFLDSSRYGPSLAESCFQALRKTRKSDIYFKYDGKEEGMKIITRCVEEFFSIL